MDRTSGKNRAKWTILLYVETINCAACRRRLRPFAGLVLGAFTSFAILGCQQPTAATPQASAQFIYSFGFISDPAGTSSLQSIQYVGSDGNVQTLNNVSLGTVEDPVWGVQMAHGWQITVEAPATGTAMSFQIAGAPFTPIDTGTVNAVTNNGSYYTLTLAAAVNIPSQNTAISAAGGYTGSFVGSGSPIAVINVSHTSPAPALGAFSIYPLPTIVMGIYRVDSGIITPVVTFQRDLTSSGVVDHVAETLSTTSF